MLEPLHNGDLLIDEQGRPFIVLHIGRIRRLEFIEGSSSKFYELWIRGATVYKHYGRIGTPGKVLNGVFENEVKAQKHYDAMLKAKIEKGYKLKGEENVYFLNAPWKTPSQTQLSHSDVDRNVRSDGWRIQKGKRT